MIDVVIVTDKALMNKDANLKSQVAFDEDNIMVQAFQKQGLSSIRAAWDDESFDWSSAKVAVIRSTWGYSHKIDSFKKWINHASKHCTLINNRELLLWNINKKYLIELNQKGINTPATFLIDKAEVFEPETWSKKLKSNGVVVKPTISADAKDTFLIKTPFTDFNKIAVETAIQQQEMIIQPFMESIKDGEISLIFINGIFIHAMLKKPQTGDFRVQEDHGGTYHKYSPSAEELSFGNLVLKTCKELKGTPVYARVDLCYDSNNRPALMELEAIEPQLWLPCSVEAVDNFVEGVMNILRKDGWATEH